MTSTSPLRPSSVGLEIDLWVVPGASRTAIAGIYDGAVRLRVAAPPAGGQANRAVVRFLRQLIGHKVRIVRGAGSRRKVVHVACDDVDSVAAALGLER